MQNNHGSIENTSFCFLRDNPLMPMNLVQCIQQMFIQKSLEAIVTNDMSPTIGKIFCQFITGFALCTRRSLSDHLQKTNK